MLALTVLLAFAVPASYLAVQLDFPPPKFPYARSCSKICVIYVFGTFCYSKLFYVFFDTHYFEKL